MGVAFGEELAARGHTVRLFEYRRDNALYKNKSTKAAYQLWILRLLERACESWRPEVVLVIKGGPITPNLVRRVKARADTLFVNFFPDNPLWMIPFGCLEAYDAFFTKERYAMRSLQQVGLRNLHYLPMYCVPSQHHPVVLSPEETRRFSAPLSFVGSRYDYRERFVRELADAPLRLWGAGWGRSPDPVVRGLVAGGPVVGHDKLCVYSGSTISLNHHHPMNDIVGVNTRTFELAAAGACQVVDAKDELGPLFKPGDELLVYRDLAELRRLLDHFLARPAGAALRRRRPARARRGPARGRRALAVRAGPAVRRSRAPRDPRRGRHAAAGLPAPLEGARRAQPGRQVRGRQPDGHREGPVVGDGRGGRAPVRLHGDLRRVERQRGLLDRRLLGPRGLALADLRVRARVGAEALAHGRHHRGSRPLRGRLRRPHHALGPARGVATLLRLRRLARRLQARGQEDDRLRGRRAARLAPCRP